MSCENLSSGVSTRSGTNRSVQSQKMARKLKFWIKKVEGLYYVVKTKALISCYRTADLRFCFRIMQK